MWRETEKVSIAIRADGGAGAFGVPGITRPDGKMECQNWYTCRDHFQNQNQNLQRFWFRIGRNTTGQRVSAFIDRIETQLQLKKRSQMGPTNRVDCIWVRWAPFWRKYSMRRSLFTALLKSSLPYDPEADNFSDTIAESKYFKKSRPALEYFLEGNTVYTGEQSATGSSGWTAWFTNKTPAQLPGLLRKPVKPATS